MTTTEKIGAREFWIWRRELGKCRRVTAAKPQMPYIDPIHVIEYAAYQALQAELDELKRDYELVEKANALFAEENSKLRRLVSKADVLLMIPYGDHVQNDKWQAEKEKFGIK